MGRINNYAAVTSFEADDYIALDGTTNGTKAMLLSKLQELIRNSLNDTELAILDGATLSTAELNILDGCTATYTELNYLAGASPGGSVASKAVVLDESEDAEIGNDLLVGGAITITGALTIGGATTTKAVTLGGNLDVDGNDIILDEDGDSKLYEKGDDVISLNLGGNEKYRADASSFGLAATGACSLGGTLDTDSSTNPNYWKDINLGGVINMLEGAVPASATVNGSCVIFMDSATGDLKVKLRHGGSSMNATLVTYSGS